MLFVKYSLTLTHSFLANRSVNSVQYCWKTFANLNSCLISPMKIDSIARSAMLAQIAPGESSCPANTPAAWSVSALRCRYSNLTSFYQIQNDALTMSDIIYHPDTNKHFVRCFQCDNLLSEDYLRLGGMKSWEIYKERIVLQHNENICIFFNS